MGFADRKSTWIKSLGDPVTIIRAGGNVSTFGRKVKGRQLLSPFEINFVRFMVFPIDSGIQRGDLIQETTLGYQAFVAATENHPQFGGNTAIYTELYVVNYSSIQVQRNMPPNVDEYGNPIRDTGGWTTVATIPMNVEHITGQMSYKDGLLLPDTVFRNRCQSSASIQLNDRVVIDSKPYQVTDINTVVSPGLHVVQVKTDTRS